jgi:lipid-binding SYLF domain-containing protein
VNKVFVYSKEEGLFAGASANGMTIQFDNEENKAVYGAAASDLITGKIDTPKGLEGLAQALKASVKPSASN